MRPAHLRSGKTHPTPDTRMPPLEKPPHSAPITWQWGRFDELSLPELYAVLQLRQVVFVVEQACPYLDADGRDGQASHLLGWSEREGEARALAAYARVFAPGVVYPEASIGRVITNPEFRGLGLGKALMSEALRRVHGVAPHSAVRIGAQLYLEKFYGEFGFARASELYDEDGIPHIQMLRAPGL